MKLQDKQARVQEQHKLDSLWNNARIATEEVTFCIRKRELVSNPFDTHGGMQWEVSIAFIWEKKKQTAKLWFSSGLKGTEEEVSLTRWDEILGDNTVDYPAHNFQLKYFVPGDSKKGYFLQWTELPDKVCPCSAFQTQVREAAPVAQIAAPAPEEVDAILVEAGFEPTANSPATDGQKRQLLALSSRLKSLTGVAVDPGDMENMTQFQAANRIEAMEEQMAAHRRAWMQKSALSGTDKLSS